MTGSLVACGLVAVAWLVTRAWVEVRRTQAGGLVALVQEQRRAAAAAEVGINRAIRTCNGAGYAVLEPERAAQFVEAMGNKVVPQERWNVLMRLFADAEPPVDINAWLEEWNDGGATTDNSQGSS